MSNRVTIGGDLNAIKNIDGKVERRVNTNAQSPGQIPARMDQTKFDSPEREYLTERAVEQIKQKLERTAELLKDAQISEAARKKAAEEAFEELENNQTYVKFELEHELDNQLIVKIVRKGSGEVVWQYPPSQSLALQRLAKYMPGIFLNTLT
ncbi:MAG: flagellar protein FlaG [Deferribacteraceae bacterium]|jgi:uncharacterized FlaG/YvyC family protein|nr:flagellar protein FlaG [Deferribacteraceae bacterium]